jgi:hypothetical protein
MATLVVAFPFFIAVVDVSASQTVRRGNHLTLIWVRAIAHCARYTARRIQHALAWQPVNAWRREQGPL